MCRRTVEYDLERHARADPRGLKVTELGALRSAMRSAGGEYKVYKNTLVRLAAKELGIDIDDVLVGPTALAFISTKSDGTPGDIAAVAKAVQDFAKGQPLLVLKGGLLGDKVLDAAGGDQHGLVVLPAKRVAGAVGHHHVDPFFGELVLGVRQNLLVGVGLLADRNTDAAK